MMILLFWRVIDRRIMLLSESIKLTPVNAKIVGFGLPSVEGNITSRMMHQAVII